MDVFLGHSVYFSSINNSNTYAHVWCRAVQQAQLGALVLTSTTKELHECLSTLGTTLTPHEWPHFAQIRTTKSIQKCIFENVFRVHDFWPMTNFWTMTLKYNKLGRGLTAESVCGARYGWNSFISSAAAAAAFNRCFCHHYSWPSLLNQWLHYDRSHLNTAIVTNY